MKFITIFGAVFLLSLNSFGKGTLEVDYSITYISGTNWAPRYSTIKLSEDPSGFDSEVKHFWKKTEDFQSFFSTLGAKSQSSRIRALVDQLPDGQSVGLIFNIAPEGGEYFELSVTVRRNGVGGKTYGIERDSLQDHWYDAVSTLNLPKSATGANIATFNKFDLDAVVSQYLNTRFSDSLPR